MKSLVNNTYLLQKFAGKGGWTYALIPEVLQNKGTPFGWVKVTGAVDGIEIRCKLMPIKNRQLFLPLNAVIRKKINKQAGDTIHVILYPDNEPIQIPEELLLCLKDEPTALHSFNKLTEGEQKNHIDWIYSAKKQETQANRIAAIINQLTTGLKTKD